MILLHLCGTLHEPRWAVGVIHSLRLWRDVSSETHETCDLSGDRFSLNGSPDFVDRSVEVYLVVLDEVVLAQVSHVLRQPAVVHL